VVVEGIMKALVKGAAVGLALVILAASSSVYARSYSEKNLRGDYVFTMTGVVTFFAGSPAGLPTYSVGVFTMDGRGNLTDTRALFNVAGCVDIEYTDLTTEWSTYTVDEDGLGSASAAVQGEVVSTTDGVGCPSISLPTDVVFEFNFALRANGKVADVTGIAVKDLDGDPILAWGGYGSIERQ
jgi:hypothetical protein